MFLSSCLVHQQSGTPDEDFLQSRSYFYLYSLSLLAFLRNAIIGIEGFGFGYWHRRIQRGCFFSFHFFKKEMRAGSNSELWRGAIVVCKNKELVSLLLVMRFAPWSRLREDWIHVLYNFLSCLGVRLGNRQMEVESTFERRRMNGTWEKSAGAMA